MVPKQPEPITLWSKSARARVQHSTTSGPELFIGKGNVALFPSHTCGGEEP